MTAIAERRDVAARRARLDQTRGPIAPVQLAHVVRRTNRFDELVDWYCTVLGAKVVHSNGMLAFLTYDQEHHRIAIARLPNLVEQADNAAGTDHIAFTHADLGDLLNTYVRLKALGVVPYWCVNHGPTTSMYYKDPDGSRVELQVDNLPTAESVDRWMRSPAFAANPIGVIFDPDALLERYVAGEPIDELTARPALPNGTGPFDMLRL
ncbi:MAG TPA: VOC family protein [Pseudomonadales bacterium]|nr:VOC family protein [Pseudomonadales bacterium]